MTCQPETFPRKRVIQPAISTKLMLWTATQRRLLQACTNTTNSGTNGPNASTKRSSTPRPFRQRARRSSPPGSRPSSPCEKGGAPVTMTVRTESLSPPLPASAASASAFCAASPCHAPGTTTCTSDPTSCRFLAATCARSSQISQVQSMAWALLPGRLAKPWASSAALPPVKVKKSAAVSTPEPAAAHQSVRPRRRVRPIWPRVRGSGWQLQGSWSSATATRRASSRAGESQLQMASAQARSQSDHCSTSLALAGATSKNGSSRSSCFRQSQ
mmetsp:Transcript_95392/g.294260  ORF Transcript_95392/g.294260 Transcript_95392/m.294260 type:complete len:272 (-) Transcript_95392:279-1094(-)